MRDVLLVGLGSGVISLALARGTLFEPLRRRLPGLLGELASCPLCLGAYAAGALWVAQETPGGQSAWVLWAASWAVSTGYVAIVERLSGD